MGKNHWIYPALYQAMDGFRELADKGSEFRETYRAVLNQYVRELLLAQASDWAFNIWLETTHVYARKRIAGHLENMAIIRKQIEAGTVDAVWLDSVQRRNNIFEDMDLLKTYSRIRDFAGRVSASTTSL